MFDDCIVLAGGSGARLWPASSARRPKQFLSLPGGGSSGSGHTFFDGAVERALAVTEPGGRVIVIVGAAHAGLAAEALADYGPRERGRIFLIAEPLARSTAAAIACGVVFAIRAAGAAASGSAAAPRLVLTLSSDHVIRPLSAFTACAARAADQARRGRLVVFGVPPTGPETGYGYIEAAEPFDDAGVDKTAGAAAVGKIFRAASFHEKPNRAAAEAYLARGNFFWNSGMFAFATDFCLAEFRRHAPEILGPFEALPAPAVETPAASADPAVHVDPAARMNPAAPAWPGLEAAYAAVPAVSFDRAIAEKCASVAMVRADFEWADVGSWDEYARLAAAAAGAPGAAAAGAAVFREGSASTWVDADIPVALCEADDLIVVIRSGRDGAPPVALIARKGETQAVRGLVERIKAAGRTDLL